MNAIDRIAPERLAVLQLAERLGNASEACRRSGVDRTSFYKWKRRFARDGIAGLGNRPPVHRSHPQATPADVSRQIVAFALANPAHGCDRIARALAKRGVEVSAVTIQKILHKAGLGTSECRGAALEAHYARGTKLSAGQMDFLEKINPCLRERGAGKSRPGEVLCQGTFFLGRFESIGATYVHAVVDLFSCYAFGMLADASRTESSIVVLEHMALPFFARRQIGIQAVLTSRLGATSTLMLRECLLAKDIEHRVGETDRMNGVVERFRRIVVVEFLRRPLVRRLYHAALARLQREFDEWLVSYNTVRPLNGYPNYGAPPYRLITKNDGTRSG
jgi:transposase InsO family protein